MFGNKVLPQHSHTYAHTQKILCNLNDCYYSIVAVFKYRIKWTVYKIRNDIHQHLHVDNIIQCKTLCIAIQCCICKFYLQSHLVTYSSDRWSGIVGCSVVKSSGNFSCKFTQRILQNLKFYYRWNGKCINLIKFSYYWANCRRVV